MEPSLVIFDLDGTLADTKPGIAASWSEVARRMGFPEPDVGKAMSKGGSFLEAIRVQFGLEGEDVFKAGRIMRDHYCSEGYLMARPFTGIEEVLKELKSRGIPVGVATMKLEDIARKMVSSWGLDDLVSYVYGADPEGMLDKADLIRKCMGSAGVRPEDTVMVGDTVDDLRGSDDAGTRFLAVTYGYGLTEGACEELGVPYAGSPCAVLDLIRSLPGYVTAPGTR